MKYGNLLGVIQRNEYKNTEYKSVGIRCFGLSRSYDTILYQK